MPIAGQMGGRTAGVWRRSRMDYCRSFLRIGNMTNDYNLVEDLTKKLMTYSTAMDIRAAEYASDHNNSAVELICRLILKSSLRTEKLSRSVVSDLLAGKI